MCVKTKRYDIKTNYFKRRHEYDEFNFEGSRIFTTLGTVLQLTNSFSEA